MAPLQRSSGRLCLVPAVLILGLSGARTAVAAPQAAPAASSAAREMAGHFAEVSAIHEAIIRGDLPGARKGGEALAARTFTDVPEKGAAYAASMKQLAGRIAASSDIGDAAASVATMLGACGDCHRTVGAMPVPAVPARPSVGEAVGHMLDHQRALDQLMQGLVVPSASLWNQGAQALRTAPLTRGKLPKDPKLTADIAASETRVHQIADDAAGASETEARVAIYGRLLGTCASCHSLHSNIWGPSKR